MRKLRPRDEKEHTTAKRHDPSGLTFKPMHSAGMQSWARAHCPAPPSPRSSPPHPALPSVSQAIQPMGRHKEGPRAWSPETSPGLQGGGPMSPHTQGSLRHMSPPPLYPYEVETDHLIALTHPGISSSSPLCAKNDLSVEQVGGEFENYTNDETKSFLHIISILFFFFLTALFC